MKNAYHELERQREFETCPSCGHGSAKIPGSHASPRLPNQEKPLDITTILADSVSAQDGRRDRYRRRHVVLLAEHPHGDERIQRHEYGTRLHELVP